MQKVLGRRSVMTQTVVRFSAGAVLFVTIALVHLFAESKDKTNNTARTPVLVELFTSEGCSDCPPADALLERLDRAQPVAGVQLIVLSEHVDYWNHIGWKDPWSSHAYSERQSAYAARFSLDSVYTPQMVVDGKLQFVGSDERRALAAVATAAQAPKLSMSLSGAHMVSDGVLTVHLDAAPLPSTSSGPTSLLIAVLDEKDESHVTAGENGGRTLKHVAVLRDLKRIGSLDASKGVSQSVEVAVPRGSGNMRVAFAQDGTAGTIRGIAEIRFSK
jgi:hypothetical protein